MEQIRAISRLKFGKDVARYFDSAALGKRRENTRDPRSFVWDQAVKVVQQKFSKLLGQSTNTISVFHNTTAAVQRILLRLSQLLGPTSPTLLLTDLEYPGIVSAVDETWSGRVVMAEVADLVWRKETASITTKLKECILLARPSVVYLSHVARATGYRLDDSIIEFIRLCLPRTVIIIDGAQSCGNIHIDGDFISRIDFYVTSGHKWLCGRQTLGLVYAKECWGTKDPAQSYSMTKGSTGTGSQDVIISLQESLSDFNGELTNESAMQRMLKIEEHNGRLAESFSEEMVRRKLGRPVGLPNKHNKGKHPWKWNGISTVVFDSYDMVERLKASRCNFTQLPSESWRDNFGAEAPGNRYFFNADQKYSIKRANFRESNVPIVEGYPARFCFHYYHSQKDVDGLLSSIQRVIKEPQNKAAGKRASNR